MGHPFPEKLTLKFVSSITKMPIAGLIVLVILKAKEKNDYSLVPLLTDKNGELNIFKQDAIKIITKAQIEAPMDYAGTLEDVTSLKIVVENDQALRERYQRILKYYPEDAQFLSRLISSATNSTVRNAAIDYNLLKPYLEVEVDFIQT